MPVKTFSIQLDDEVVDQLDAYAEADNRSRNSLLRKIITDWVRREQEKS